MTDDIKTDMPKLDAPGAGLPIVQETLLKYFAFPIFKRIISWDRAAAMFEREGRAILALIADVPEEHRFKRVLVPRMLGIEDSSRYWSMAMALDHLMIVPRGIMVLMTRLSRGADIEVVVDPANVKPCPDTPPDIVERYEKFLARFRGQLAGVKNRDVPHCHVHPWFGCLNPHGWLAMLAIHQWIHRRQVARMWQHWKTHGARA